MQERSKESLTTPTVEKNIKEKTRKDLDALSEEIEDQAAVNAAKEYLLEKAREKEVEIKIEDTIFMGKDHPGFTESIQFIQSHTHDFPGNAELDPEKVKCIVLVGADVLGDDLGEEYVTIALNNENEVIGVAD